MIKIYCNGDFVVSYDNCYVKECDDTFEIYDSFSHDFYCAFYKDTHYYVETDNRVVKRTVSFNLDEKLIADVKNLSLSQGIRPSDFYRNAVKTYVDQQKTINVYQEMIKALSNLAVITDLKDPEQLKILQDFQNLSRMLGNEIDDK